MRLIIVGCESYIALHVLKAAQHDNIECVPLPFNRDVTAAVRPGDVVINFAIHPDYKSMSYSEAVDCDLKVARVATAASARVVMISSRKVYPEAARWNAREEDTSSGDGSHYGDNKAITEAGIRAISNARATIFRLSNICGYEFEPVSPRPTFFGIMQHSLKSKNIIRFDMHPSTRRDFLPVEYCASAILMAVEAGIEGTYNLGSGFAVPCGDIARWVMEGYGGGELIVEPPFVRDEFYLNMEMWKARFGSTPIKNSELHRYCLEIGQRLKCEKS